MSIMRASGRQPGSLPLLLLFLSLWINGCQTPEPPSSGKIGSDTTWTITAQAGAVSLRSPHQSFWHRATPGTRIPPGSQVVTVDGSRLEMASAGDKLTTSGPSRFTLPEAEDNGVRVRQDTGSLRYEVQSAPKRRFEVKTPHFSTVVKGTIFLISIDRASSEVFVDEGRVLILDAKGEPLTELTAGQIGRMAAQPGSTLEVGTGPEPSFERIFAFLRHRAGLRRPKSRPRRAEGRPALRGATRRKRWLPQQLTGARYRNWSRPRRAGYRTPGPRRPPARVE